MNSSSGGISPLIRRYYSVLPTVSRSYPEPEGRWSIYSSPFRRWRIATPARLACLIHAANIHSEPGSNPSIEVYAWITNGYCSASLSWFAAMMVSSPTFWSPREKFLHLLVDRCIYRSLLLAKTEIFMELKISGCCPAVFRATAIGFKVENRQPTNSITTKLS